MKISRAPSGRKLGRKVLLILSAFMLSTLALHAQTCLTSADMDESTQTALVNTAQRFFEMAARGDAPSLRQNAIASLATNFVSIEAAIKDNQAALGSAQAKARPPYLLKAEGMAPLDRGEFLCGVFGANGQTSNSAVFMIPGLPPGNYAVVILDVTTGKSPYTVSFVLQQEGSVWKLGGYYVKVSQINGHDGLWFADHARQYKAKGQALNAWFYHLEARELLVPVPFMSTLETDKLYDEFQNAMPADLPPADIAAGGKSFHLTQMFPLAVGDDLDLVVKYSSPSISDTGKTFEDNVAVIKGVVAKYPELREAFQGAVARAVDPSGKDYGTMLPMKSVQ